jgi:hypothetical protein
MTNELGRAAHVEDFCHVIEQDADGLWSCQCSKDHETLRDCENACLAKAMEEEVSYV